VATTVDGWMAPLKVRSPNSVGMVKVVPAYMITASVDAYVVDGLFAI